MSLVERLLIGLVMALAVAGGSYWAGDRNRDNAWVAKQSKTALLAQKKFDAEVLRGQDAAADYLAAKGDFDTRYSDLERKLNDKARRVPLVATCNSAPDTKAGGLVVPEPDAGPSLPTGTGEAGVRGDVVPDPVLSNAAVWMWDSALTGTDRSTAACGSADATDTACAAASGITVSDAWANHEANAKSCAADRLRYQRLIDFLKGKTQ